MPPHTGRRCEYGRGGIVPCNTRRCRLQRSEDGWGRGDGALVEPRHPCQRRHHRPSGLRGQPRRQGPRSLHHRRHRHRQEGPPRDRRPPLPRAQNQTAQRMPGLHSTPSASCMWPGCEASQGSTGGPHRPPPSQPPWPLQKAWAPHSRGKDMSAGTVAARLSLPASDHANRTYRKGVHNDWRWWRRWLQPRRQGKWGRKSSPPLVGGSRRRRQRRQRWRQRRQRWRQRRRGQPVIARGPCLGWIDGVDLPPPVVEAPPAATTTPPALGTLPEIATVPVSGAVLPPFLVVARQAPQATAAQVRRSAAPRVARAVAVARSPPSQPAAATPAAIMTATMTLRATVKSRAMPKGMREASDWVTQRRPPRRLAPRQPKSVSKNAAAQGRTAETVVATPAAAEPTTRHGRPPPPRRGGPCWAQTVRPTAARRRRAAATATLAAATRAAETAAAAATGATATATSRSCRRQPPPRWLPRPPEARPPQPRRQTRHRCRAPQ